MNPLTRRHFVRTTTLAAAAGGWAGNLAAASPGARGSEGGGAPSGAAAGAAPDAPLSRTGRATVRWLDGAAPAASTEGACGVPWTRGECPAGTRFQATTADGRPVPLQSWPLATWPDGSLKWTGHALPGDVLSSSAFVVAPGEGPAPEQPVAVREDAAAVVLSNGRVTLTIDRSGPTLFRRLERDGRRVAEEAELVCLRQESEAGARREVRWTGHVDRLDVEQRGPVRAVVRLEGRHRAPGGAAGPGWLPFVVRLYLHAGSERIRIMHTFVYEGDPRRDVIAGLGVSFRLPQAAPLHDRHVRFSGQADGLFAEAVRGLTGLRRDPGAAVRAAQLAGEATPPVETWDRRVSARLQYIPAWGDWTLLQAGSDGFEIRKRTREGYGWISAARGERAGGLVSLSSPTGGLAFGIRNFWESHPAQLDLREAQTERATGTAWIWAPDAGPMDLRPYHDGMGQDTFAKQLEGLEITYEDWEPGFDLPEGVSRTSELFLWALAATPPRERLAALAEQVRTPPALVATTDHLHRCRAFGGLWAPADRTRPGQAAIEDALDDLFDFYVGQREQRRWYGFWNYGDVMHSYDTDRREWKYDIGGFAWDNSELSTDIWLWLYALRTGRADAFRFAEAMTRHTGEVDVHHLGRFAPLGSRHNVLHWGCSAKQLRISTAANRRYYYYLTGDERVGELMREQVEAARALTTIQANRKVARDLVTAPDPNAKEVFTGFGTDWGSLAAAWLTEWERTGDPRMRARLEAGMRTIAGQPRRFLTGGSRMNIDTGAFVVRTDDRLGVSHLSAVFGLPEVCAEIIDLIDEPTFREAWLEYCELYNAPADEQARRLGQALRGLNLQQGHSRLTAYAARMRGDPALAARAWGEFRRGEAGLRRMGVPDRRRVSGPAVLRPVEESPTMTTNAAAQWGLAAIQCLALVGEHLPPG